MHLQSCYISVQLANSKAIMNKKVEGLLDGRVVELVELLECLPQGDDSVLSEPLLQVREHTTKL